MTEHASDDSNLYAPPQAAVVDIALVRDDPFYVVAPVKCMALFFATLGLYAFYWFWRHWSLQKRRYGLDLWPVPRAVFYVFFTHRLFREIDVRLKRVDARDRWSPEAMAWLFVMFAVTGNVLDRLAQAQIGFPIVDALALLTLLPMAYALLQAQRAANSVCGDPKGDGNRYFTAANYLWLIFGFALWALIAIAMLATIPGVMK
jgi:hypothetical protein